MALRSDLLALLRLIATTVPAGEERTDTDRIEASPDFDAVLAELPSPDRATALLWGIAELSKAGYLTYGEVARYGYDRVDDATRAEQSKRRPCPVFLLDKGRDLLAQLDSPQTSH